jgi:C4-dicarboxylate transporter DctQ subunit
LAEAAFSWFTLTRNLDVIMAGFFLTVMILVVLCQIVLRNFFNSGLSFGDDLVRHLVLWVVFLGASVAARENRHIRIDIMARVFPPQISRYIDGLVALFSTAICFTMSWAAFMFVREEFGSGFTMNMFNTPIWVMETIIPAGYFIIAVHLGVSGVLGFMKKENR